MWSLGGRKRAGHRRSGIARMMRKDAVSIVSARFTLRPLKISDVGKRYLSWFDDAVAKRYIDAARRGQTLDSLRHFVEEKHRSPHALLLGIFTTAEGEHIGNIKFEPINFEQGAAVVGVLVGETGWRGKAVFQEAFVAAAGYLQTQCGIKTYWLGVDASNDIAAAVYTRLGFVDACPPNYV